MTKNGKKRIERAKKILGEVTTHDLDNLEQAQMILDAMRLLSSVLDEPKFPEWEDIHERGYKR